MHAEQQRTSFSRRGRQLLAVLGVLSLLAAATGWLQPPPPALAQSASELWGAPVNLSQSGAASQPVVAAGPNGALHALWWDRFDGTKYASYTPDFGWSNPITVRTLLGARTRTGELVPPRDLVFLADSAGWLHAFWRADDGDLMYANKRAGPTEWSVGVQLATNPLAFDVSVDASNRVHVAFIKPNQTGNLPAGVYYRQSTNNGNLWSNAVLAYESLYFRTLNPAWAHVNVASDGQREVLVTWDDPQLGQSIFARVGALINGFSEPTAIQAGDVAGGAPAQRTRLSYLPDGRYLALWQAGSGCAIFQQLFDPAAGTWTPPLRVLATLASCPGAQRDYITTDGKLFSVFSLNSGGLALATWDGTVWSEPYTSQISFLHPLTNRVTELGCLNVTLAGEQIAAIGCDANGDIWLTTSQVGLADLLPALQTNWSPPTLLTQTDAEASLPATAVDATGLVHVLWAEAQSLDRPFESLTYARSDGDIWTVTNNILRSPGGKTDQPTLAADLGGMLHAAWSGGEAGRIYYSRAFVRDATTPRGWSTPVPVPAPQSVGASPKLQVDRTGALHLVYVIPLNEDRGVYYLRSDDQGVTWTEPQRVFDAVAAGWPAVGQADMAVDEAGRVHVMWTRTSLPNPITPLGAYYTRSDDGGVTWLPAEAVGSAQATRPQVITAGADQVHRFWLQPILNRSELWHQVSVNGGQTWLAPQRALDSTETILPAVSLAADSAGTLFMLGVERTAENAAVLTYFRWDGLSWLDRERVPLGYDPADQSGAVALLQPQGRLGAFYRLRAPRPDGGSHYVVGYTERPVTVAPVEIPATITPPPEPTATIAPTVAPTAAPSPTPDLNVNSTAPPSDNTFWLQIGGILGGMLLVTLLAVVRLRGGRR